VIVLQIIGWLWLILFGGCCLVMLGTLLYAGKDWKDRELARQSMILMAEKVMPAVNAALGKSVAAE